MSVPTLKVTMFMKWYSYLVHGTIIWSDGDSCSEFLITIQNQHQYWSINYTNKTAAFHSTLSTHLHLPSLIDLYTKCLFNITCFNMYIYFHCKIYKLHHHFLTMSQILIFISLHVFIITISHMKNAVNTMWGWYIAENTLHNSGNMKKRKKKQMINDWRASITREN
jgi:hypothetical protein